MFTLLRQTNLRKSERGMTLVEVLAALVILAIGMASISSAMLTGVRSEVEAKHQSQAVFIAQDGLELARNIVLASETVTLENDAAVPDYPEFRRTIEISPADPGLLKIAVTVKWVDYQGGERVHTLSSLRAK